jgi:hypothetical protein
MHAVIGCSGVPWHWTLGVMWRLVTPGSARVPNRVMLMFEKGWPLSGARTGVSLFSSGRIEYRYMQAILPQLDVANFFLMLTGGVLLK